MGMPAWLGGLEKPPFSISPHYQAMSRMLREGRAFPSGHLWGLVENRLTDIFPQIWQEILREEDANIDVILKKSLVPLAERLNMTMQG